MSGAIIVGLLAATAVVLVLQRGLVRTALGLLLLGHAVNVLLVLSGGSSRRGVPFVGHAGAAADPLPQAFALTAIVISFGITAFILALAARLNEVTGSDDPEEEDR